MASWDFLEFLELFYYRKNHGTGPQTHEPSPRRWYMVSGSRLMADGSWLVARGSRVKRHPLKSRSRAEI
jgi:hypothetical protein